jgi:pilus assembly protein CpaE
MADVLRVAIVDPSDMTRDPLRNMLLGVESVWLEAECSRYEFFGDVVNQSNPDVAIVALDADQAKALQLIVQVGQDYPAMNVVAVSGRSDSFLQAHRAGAKEFLTQPVVLEDLLAVLERIRRSSHQPAPAPTSGGAAGAAPVMKPRGPTVVAVLGSRGGVGCTSLAVNMGCTLAQEPGHKVVMIDLDLALGDADVALDLIPDYTLADVAMNIDRLDMQFLRRALSQHSTGLSLLPHPVQMQDIGHIHEEHLQRVINLLKASYTHLLLDCSKGLTPTDLTAMRMSDLILLVAQLELSSLRNVVRMLETLVAEEGLSEKVRVILNRVGSDFMEGDIDLKKAQETIGRPIFWQIPNDAKAMIGSRNAGVPLIQFAPKSKAQQSITGLCHELGGSAARANGGQAAAGKPASKSLFGSIFGGS